MKKTEVIMYKKVLDEFKELESPSDAFMLVDYSAVRLVCSLWGKVSITNLINIGKVPCDLNSKWNWIWDCVNYDTDVIMDATGFNSEQIEEIIIRLKAGRLIYPDGTIHSDAATFLKSALTYSSNKNE